MKDIKVLYLSGTIIGFSTWILDDIQHASAFGSVSDGIKQFGYQKIILCGKTIGTIIIRIKKYILSHLASKNREI